MIFEARRDVPSRFRPLRGRLRGEQVDAGLVAVAGGAHYGGLDPRLALGSQVRALVGSSMPGRRGKMELSHIRPGSVECGLSGGRSLTSPLAAHDRKGRGGIRVLKGLARAQEAGEKAREVNF